MKKKFKQIENLLRAHPRALLVITLLVAAILIISRRPESMTNPQFWAEDGQTWYADAYNGNPIGTIFEPYAGYFNVINRLVASVSLLFPFDLAPLIFNLSALAIQLLPLVLINSGRLKEIIPYRSLGLLISLIYISVPNSSEVFLNLANVQWHLGVAAFLVIISASSKRWGWKIFDIAILVSAGISGTMAVLLTPIAGLQWFRTRSVRHLRQTILLAALSLVQVLSIFFFSDENRVGSNLGGNFSSLVKMIVGQIFFGGTFGEKSVNVLYGNFPVLIIILIVMIGIVGYVMWKGPLWLKLFQLYAVFIVGSMLVSLKPTSDFDVWVGLTNPGGGQRYWYIPILAWIATLLWLLFASKLKALKYVSGILIASLFVYAVPSDWHLHEYKDMHFKDYATKFDAAPSGSKVKIPINPNTYPAWYVELNKK